MTYKILLRLLTILKRVHSLSKVTNQPKLNVISNIKIVVVNLTKLLCSESNDDLEKLNLSIQLQAEFKRKLSIFWVMFNEKKLL